ncbi:flagellar biosynthetic protein FliQ [Muricomes intestini]|jgi:flagellar biosynthetic protein FliQ|uniref:Flagellar biosynthetic protein FliQ n=1 Tax=Muricomes intestini TaxID=1796634 RepID=A0A4V2USU3_9FIRM|nr:flagellar biosynthetic protein FliQ [Muricomes intestini]TCS82788.1 flagellar biosynthetic protein FliQ [Muricomes intestini]HAX51248.1 flagellar biosynthetic protein FliQ [Lachnospiraceae bacterium]HCR83305.1 flagellar biosynthetic protein FliQ [Lachnospiraceae bacterium]
MPTTGEITDLMYQLFVMAVKLAGPILIISMVVGIAISIIQAATQIHEQTLTFVPKLIVIGVLLVVTGDSMLKLLQEFTQQIFLMIAG